MTSQSTGIGDCDRASDLPLPHTVVICTYNRTDVVCANLGRLAGRLAEPASTEIIVVNNGADEHQEPIERTLRSIRDRYGIAHVVCVREPAVGLSRARNLGLAIARGAIISFLDDDTVPCRITWQSHILSAFREHDRVGLLGGPIRLMLPPETRDYTRWRSEVTDSLLSCHSGPPHPGPCEGTVIFGGNASYRRSAIVGSRFDVMLGWVSGHPSAVAGEETSLNLALTRGGWTAWFEPHADVWHYVDGQRIARKWMLSRSTQMGRTAAVLRRDAGVPFRSAKLQDLKDLFGAIRGIASSMAHRRSDWAFAFICTAAQAWASLLILPRVARRPQH